MLLFDTTESMDTALAEASAGVGKAINELDSQLADPHYGLSELRDYGGSSHDPANPDDFPWRLDVPITADKNAVLDSIKNLGAAGGGDYAEAYGRALWEMTSNSTVGWRPGSRRVVVLVTDSMPHDNNLDEGIPEADWILPAPWNTGEELRGGAGVSGTTIRPKTDLDWQNVLRQLAASHILLQVIVYRSNNGTLPYWENWAAQTGGEATPSDPGHLREKLVDLLKTAAGRLCGQVRGKVAKKMIASLKCTPALDAFRTECSRTLSIARALKSGAVGGRKNLKPLADLLKAVKTAKFLRHPPPGLGTSGRVLAAIERARTAIRLIGLLPRLAEAIRPAGVQRIAVDITKLRGASACASGLIASVS